MHRIRFVAALSLLFTALFFIEYTPLLPRTRIPYDLEGFHYPLADYAFQSLKQGRFPQWDPSTYSGLSFVGNSQTAIFYPPMWLMFALKWGSTKLPYRALEYLALAHVWLAFVLCYAWLYGRRKLHWLASILGSGGYAFGGYVMTNLQHLGLLIAYAWLPLAFLSLDEAEEKDDWRPLWKLALASAMCLLGGYPPIWVVFALCSAAYAFARSGGVRMGLWTCVALASSLLLCAVALLPAFEAARLQVPEVKYSASSGFKHPEYYVSFFIPNFFKFDMGVDPSTTSFRDYLYLGAAGLAGLALLFKRKKIADAAPLLGVLLVSLLLLVNPGGVLGWLIGNTPLAQVTVDWDFLAGVSAALAALAALGLDSALLGGAGRRPANSRAVAAAITLAVAWSIRLLILWNRSRIASGAMSAWDSIGGTILCLALIYLFARTERPLRWAVAAALILLASADYKAFGTSKQFNGQPQKNFIAYTGKTFPGMNAFTYAELQRHREYRWASEEFGPDPAALRHFGFATPQGFDPSLPAQYKRLIEQSGRFHTNRIFDLNPDDVSALRLLGVGYVIGAEQSPGYSRLKENPDFRLMQPDDSFYKVFELKDAQPAFGWEETSEGRSAVAIEWHPERRRLRLSSPAGGVFRLSEQFFPGWSATLDGALVQIERCHEAFQCVSVGPGEHLLEFRYRSRLLLPGAALSLCSMLLGMAFLRFRKPVPFAGRRPAPQSFKPLTNPRGAGLRPADLGNLAKYARKNTPRIIAAVLLAAFFWGFQGRALKSHFGPDEMMNIYGYWQPPLWKVLLANVTFWSNFVRPMVAIYYLPLFHLFKLNPVPYTWVRIALLALNTILFYKLALSVSRSWWVAVLAAFPVAYQANLGNLSFDGAFIYDTLCATFYFGALLYYIHCRGGRSQLSARPLSLTQGCVFLALYICALNSKEMAVSLPVVALAYELLFGERSPNLAHLARRLWPTLAAGAITLIFILGKALSADSLMAMDAYRPVLTWARFSESTTRFFNTIFYADGLTMEHAVTLWGVLLCAGIVSFVRRRDPRWMFLWIWVMVTPLPIVFLPGRGAGLLYLVAAGWAIAAAMLCRGVAWRLARELFAGRPARMAAMALFLLGCAAAYAYQTQIVHRYQVYGYLLTGKHTADMLVQFKKMGLQPEPGSRIVFLRDPFDGSYDMTFLAALVWDDRSLKIFQQSQVHLPEDQVAGMDYILDYTGDGFVVRKPAKGQ